MQIEGMQKMEFKYLIYRQKEMTHNGCLPKEIRQFFGRIRRYGVMVEEVTQGNLENYMEENKICPSCALILASTDRTLKEAEKLSAACIAYRNPDFLSEELFGTDFVIEGFEEIDYYFLERVYQRRHKIPWRVIETGRCYLREMEISDLPDLYELYAGKGMTEYMEPLYEWEEEVEYTKAYIKNMYRFYGYGMWLIKGRADDQLIGRAGFDHYTADGKCLLEMGYAIGVSYQRKGYALEVCQALIEYAKKAIPGYDTLYCFVREKNEASIALLEKLEFEFQKTVIRDGKKMKRYAFEIL